jgi:hypothetical protein
MSPTDTLRNTHPGRWTLAFLPYLALAFVSARLVVVLVWFILTGSGYDRQAHSLHDWTRSVWPLVSHLTTVGTMLGFVVTIPLFHRGARMPGLVALLAGLLGLSMIVMSMA